MLVDRHRDGNMKNTEIIDLYHNKDCGRLHPLPFYEHSGAYNQFHVSVGNQSLRGKNEIRSKLV